MRIEQVDAFYLRMPEVRDVGDGSQDALLIRVIAGGFVGWGECEAAPLPTIAALVAPISHSACKPVLDSVIGADLDGLDSIRAIHRRVKENSLDLLQTDHALSGIDIALWDLLGRREEAPVWSLLGSGNEPRVAYASQLFGDTPEETYAQAKTVTDFHAAKFGWGPIGKGALEEDAEQIRAAREGLGPDRTLLIDTGCVFGHDVESAAQRISLFEENTVCWWEEPFATGALKEYRELAFRTKVPLAGGEGAHTADQAKLMIDFGGVGYIQIDTGRIGGITAAREVAEYVKGRDVRFVNHTFTSNLALSASLQPFADAPAGGFAEMPVQPSDLAVAIGGSQWSLSAGMIQAPETPGLGISPDLALIKPYLQQIEILWQGRTLWRSPEL